MLKPWLRSIAARPGIGSLVLCLLLSQALKELQGKMKTPEDAAKAADRLVRLYTTSPDGPVAMSVNTALTPSKSAQLLVKYFALLTNYTKVDAKPRSVDAQRALTLFMNSLAMDR